MMIKQSFIFLSNTKQKKESNIWKQSINDWDDFLNVQNIIGLSRKSKIIHDEEIKEAKKHLQEENTKYFQKVLPSSEQWRLYNQFKNEAVYLDIETDGYRNITVIGLFDGIETKFLVNGSNLTKENLANTLNQYKLIVTFNGASFDIPFIERYFQVNLNHIHIDLRHVCSKLGLKGGLKEIEKQLNIQRPKELECLRGHNAVELWKMWKVTGEERYIKLLLQYNDEDCYNLKRIAEYSIPKLWNQIRNP